MDRGAWWATVHGITGVRHNLVTKPPQQKYWKEEVLYNYMINSSFYNTQESLGCELKKSFLSLFPSPCV